VKKTKTYKHAPSSFPATMFCNQKRLSEINKDLIAWNEVWINGTRDWLPDALQNPQEIGIELKNGDMIMFKRYKMIPIDEQGK
jgi:hypothetical protein